MTLDTGLENSAMAAENSTAPQGNPYHQYTLGEDGNWYRGDERVYYWVSPAETDSTIGGGSETQGIGQDLGGYYTEAEIRAAWDANEGMGKLQEQTDWDNYWGFISERQAEIQAGNLVDPIQADFAGQAATYAAENTDADAEIANTGRDEEIYYAQSDVNKQTALQDQMNAWVDQNSALMDKYGIPVSHTTNSGDVYVFNGSTYSRAFKADDHDYGPYVAIVAEALKGWMMTGGLAALAGAGATAIAGKIAELAQYGKNWQGFVSSIPNLPAGIQEWLIKAGNGIASGTGQIIGGAAAAGGAAGAYGGYDGMPPPFNPNVIVNLTNAGGSNSGGADMTPPKEDINDDGTRTYGSFNLPPGYVYNDVRGVVIHEETGEEYPVTYTTYGNKEGGSPYNWIVNLPVDEGGGGGGNTGSTDGSTSGGAPMSQAEAAAILQELVDKGLTGKELNDAVTAAGIPYEMIAQAIADGSVDFTWSIFAGDEIPDDGTKPPETIDGKPNLVLYDGNPNLLDENGAWVAGGTFFDRTDPENPRKYYVWVNKNTGEEYKIYDDELGTYDGGVKDFEAYLKDELPDITEDELILARRLIEMGDPVGQVIADIIAGRKDLNDSNTDTVTLPSGETVEVPTTDNRKEGDPCSIGDKYNGTVVVAPSGQLVCKIDFGDSDNTVDNDGNPDATPDGVPKEGDPCPLPGGAGEGVIKDGVCQPRTGTTSTAIVPSLVCESGWSDSAGICIPVDDPRISGTNTPAPGQCPVGYSKNRRGECVPNTQGDMGGESEGDGENGNIPNDGEPCEVDGKQGTYQDGVCVISTNTVNPGVIDLTGGSEWGDSGDGGGDNGGQGPGEGPGSGPGEGGNGGGNGPGLGDVGARKGSSNPVWSPIPPGYKFRRFVKRQGIGANAPMIQQPTFQNPDFTGMRAGLLSSMMNQVKKT